LAREDAAERDAALERDLDRGILERPPGSVSRPFSDERHEKRVVDAESAADEWLHGHEEMIG